MAWAGLRFLFVKQRWLTSALVPVPPHAERTAGWRNADFLPTKDR